MGNLVFIKWNYSVVLLVQVDMDMNYHDNQYYDEPCNNCGFTGHWVQDFLEYNQYGGGPEYPSYPKEYNQDYHPRRPPDQDNYQSEPDPIRADMMELAKVVHEVVQQQDNQAKAHQALIDQVAHLTKIVGSIIKEVGKPCSAHQSYSSETTNSAHLKAVSFNSSFEYTAHEPNPPPVVKRKVEYSDSESELNQDFISQNNLKTENVNKPVRITFPNAIIKPFSKEKDPTQDER
ncbi:hypothetical protein L1987_70630 [Smallanthus sonchifolius]|uniref:Uncharacterized protein n=1 Tax=Smallanthus sonchifolius TaxID=185202 RepID=A0ACB9AQS2_9ASTR|nr:hypothetical protein L1987_70630 [Smallanthus sonchifolius]